MARDAVSIGQKAKKRAPFHPDPFGKTRDGLESKFATALRRSFARQYPLVRKAMLQQKYELLAAQADWRKRQKRRSKAAAAGIASKAGDNYGIKIDWNQETEYMLLDLQEALAVLPNAAKVEIAGLYSQLGGGINWSLYNAQAAAKAAQYSYNLVSAISAGSNKMLGQAIGDWIAKGAAFPDLVESVWRIFPGSAFPNQRDRAALIAATETTRVFAETQADILQAAGLQEMHWRTAFDELVCPICAPMGAAEMGEGAKGNPASRLFLSPATGAALSIPAHPGCRCWAVASPSELEALAEQAPPPPKEWAPPEGAQPWKSLKWKEKEVLYKNALGKVKGQLEPGMNPGDLEYYVPDPDGKKITLYYKSPQGHVIVIDLNVPPGGTVEKWLYDKHGIGTPPPAPPAPVLAPEPEFETAYIVPKGDLETTDYIYVYDELFAPIVKANPHLADADIQGIEVNATGTKARLTIVQANWDTTIVVVDLAPDSYAAGILKKYDYFKPDLVAQWQTLGHPEAGAYFNSLIAGAESEKYLLRHPDAKLQSIGFSATGDKAEITLLHPQTAQIKQFYVDVPLDSKAHAAWQAAKSGRQFGPVGGPAAYTDFANLGDNWLPLDHDGAVAYLKQSGLPTDAETIKAYHHKLPAWWQSHGDGYVIFGANLGEYPDLNLLLKTEPVTQKKLWKSLNKAEKLFWHDAALSEPSYAAIKDQIDELTAIELIDGKTLHVKYLMVDDNAIGHLHIPITPGGKLETWLEAAGFDIAPAPTPVGPSLGSQMADAAEFAWASMTFKQQGLLLDDAFGGLQPSGKAITTVKYLPPAPDASEGSIIFDFSDGDSWTVIIGLDKESWALGKQALAAAAKPESFPGEIKVKWSSLQGYEETATFQALFAQGDELDDLWMGTISGIEDVTIIDGGKKLAIHYYPYEEPGLKTYIYQVKPNTAQANWVADTAKAHADLQAVLNPLGQFEAVMDVNASITKIGKQWLQKKVIEASPAFPPGAVPIKSIEHLGLSNGGQTLTVSYLSVIDTLETISLPVTPGGAIHSWIDVHWAPMPMPASWPIQAPPPPAATAPVVTAPPPSTTGIVYGIENNVLDWEHLDFDAMPTYQQELIAPNEALVAPILAQDYKANLKFISFTDDGSQAILFFESPDHVHAPLVVQVPPGGKVAAELAAKKKPTPVAASVVPDGFSPVTYDAVVDYMKTQGWGDVSYDLVKGNVELMPSHYKINPDGETEWHWTPHKPPTMADLGYAVDPPTPPAPPKKKAPAKKPAAAPAKKPAAFEVEPITDAKSEYEPPGPWDGELYEVTPKDAEAYLFSAEPGDPQPTHYSKDKDTGKITWWHKPAPTAPAPAPQDGPYLLEFAKLTEAEDDIAFLAFIAPNPEKLSASEGFWVEDAKLTTASIAPDGKSAVLVYASPTKTYPAFTVPVDEDKVESLLALVEAKKAQANPAPKPATGAAAPKPPTFAWDDLDDEQLGNIASDVAGTTLANMPKFKQVEFSLDGKYATVTLVNDKKVTLSIPPKSATGKWAKAAIADAKKAAKPAPAKKPAAPKKPAPAKKQAAPPTPVVAPPKPAPLPARPPKPESFPFQIEQLKSTGRGGLSGAHTKEVFEAPDGSKWLYKPQDEFRAYGDKVAYDLAYALDHPGAETYTVTVNGRIGSIQRMMPLDGDLSGKSITSLGADDVRAVQKEAIFDWLIGNHDGHEQNLIYSGGKMVGIDKGQLFKFYDQDRLHWDYNPNAGFGVTSVEHKLFQAYSKGQNVAVSSYRDDAELVGFMTRIERLDDEQFKAILRPYAERAAKFRISGSKVALAYQDVDKFLNEAVKRKNRIRSDFGKLWDEAVAARSKALGIPIPVAAPQVLTPITPEFANGIVRSGWQGQALRIGATDIENQAALLYKLEGDGTMMEFKVRLGAEPRLLARLNELGAVLDVTPTTDPYWQRVLTVVKSYQAHLSPTSSYYDGVVPQKTVAGIKGLLIDLAAEKDKGIASHYQSYLEVMLNDIETASPTLVGKALNPYTPPAPKPASRPSPTPSVKQTVAMTEGVRNERGRLIYDPKLTIKHTGKGFEIDLGDGITARYILHADGNGAIYSKQGRMHVQIDGDPSPERIQAALDRLSDIGLNTALVTPQENELMYLGKVTYAAKLDRDVPLRPGMTVEQQIETYKSFWAQRLGVDDITKLPNYQPNAHYDSAAPILSQAGERLGMPYWTRFDIDPDQFGSEMKGYVLTHQIGAYSRPPSSVKVDEELELYLANNGNLLSTEERFRLGIPVGDHLTGSPTQDQSTGGASYSFTRIWEKSHAQGFGEVHLLFDPKLLLETDTVSYDHDKFGNSHPDDLRIERLTQPDQWKRAAGNSSRITNRNETNRKGGISLRDYLIGVNARSAAEKKRVIAVLQKYGFTSLGGKSLEDAIHIVR